MDLSKILSISGKSGLFSVISQMKNAVLVESLIDKKRFPAFAHEKISSLEEIAVFTTGEDKPLKDILKAMFENQEKNPAPDTKADGKALAAYFESVVPDYDKERVYISDIKKIVAWYNLLLENNLLNFEEEEKKEDEEKKEAKDEEISKETTEQKDEVVAEKPKKAAAKKTKKD